jgi:hypothetical protein
MLGLKYGWRKAGILSGVNILNYSKNEAES